MEYRSVISVSHIFVLLSQFRSSGLKCSVRLFITSAVLWEKKSNKLMHKLTHQHLWRFQQFSFSMLCTQGTRLDGTHTQFTGAEFTGGTCWPSISHRHTSPLAFCNYNGTQNSGMFHSERAPQPLSCEFFFKLYD